MNKHKHESGAVNPLLIASIILAIISAGFAGAFFWAFNNYQDYKNNTTAKVEAAVTVAKKEQADVDNKLYLEQAKQPYVKLVAPDDLGKVSISYPKTWSVYVARSSSSNYEAYLHPNAVPTVSSTQPFATRIVVTEQKYEQAIAQYDGLVKKGDLKSTPVTINNFNGVRIDGKFSTTRAGSAVFFKVRDKTLIVSTDIDSFKSDFDNIVIKSLDFNP